MRPGPCAGQKAPPGASREGDREEQVSCLKALLKSFSARDYAADNAGCRARAERLERALKELVGQIQKLVPLDRLLEGWGLCEELEGLCIQENLEPAPQEGLEAEVEAFLRGVRSLSLVTGSQDLNSSVPALVCETVARYLQMTGDAVDSGATSRLSHGFLSRCVTAVRSQSPAADECDETLLRAARGLMSVLCGPGGLGAEPATQDLARIAIDQLAAASWGFCAAMLQASSAFVQAGTQGKCLREMPCFCGPMSAPLHAMYTPFAVLLEGSGEPAKASPPPWFALQQLSLPLAVQSQALAALQGWAARDPGRIKDADLVASCTAAIEPWARLRCPDFADRWPLPSRACDRNLAQLAAALQHLAAGDGSGAGATTSYESVVATARQLSRAIKEHMTAMASSI